MRLGGEKEYERRMRSDGIQIDVKLRPDEFQGDPTDFVRHHALHHEIKHYKQQASILFPMLHSFVFQIKLQYA